MNAGLGNAGVRASKTPLGSPGPIAAANNGLSLDTATGTIAQLGNDTGGATAILLSDREIPMAGFSFKMKNGANQQLLIDPTTGDYKIGDIDFAVAGTSIIIADGANQAITLNATNELIGADPNTGKRYLYVDHFFGKHYQFGDIGGAAHQMFLDINSTTQRLQVFSGGPATSYLELNVPVGVYNIGDINNSNNHCLLQVDDANKIIIGLLNGSAQLYMNLTAGLYGFGDYSSIGNGTFLSIDDTAQKTTLTKQFQLSGYGTGAYPGVPAYTLQVDASGNIIEGAGGGGGWGTTGTVATLTGNANVELAGNTISITDTTVSFFTVDTTGGGNYFLGDLNNTNNGTYIQLADSFSGIFICTKVGAFTGASVVDIRPPNYKFGDVDISANGTRLFIDDSIQKISLISAGGTGVGGIQTNAPSAAGPGLWLLGRIIVGASVLDATQYIEAMVDSVLYKLALAQ